MPTSNRFLIPKLMILVLCLGGCSAATPAPDETPGPEATPKLVMGDTKLKDWPNGHVSLSSKGLQVWEPISSAKSASPSPAPSPDEKRLGKPPKRAVLVYVRPGKEAIYLC